MARLAETGIGTGVDVGTAVDVGTNVEVGSGAGLGERVGVGELASRLGRRVGRSEDKTAEAGCCG